MSSAIGDANGVDLNQASEQELENVGGIGRERAHRIIQRRPLASWDDVKRIPGFSDKLVDDLRGAGARIGNEGHGGGSSERHGSGSDQSREGRGGASGSEKNSSDKQGNR